MDKRAFLQELLNQGLISESDMRLVLRIEKEKHQSFGRILIDQKILTEKSLYDYICYYLGMNPTDDYFEKSYAISGITIPKFNVSGDFFGFFPLDEELIAITLCDVCGKGLEAGLLAIILANIVKNAIKNQSLTPAGITRKVNRTSRIFFDKDQFATFSIMVLNTVIGTIDFCCAGTPPIMVYRKKENYVEELEVAGIPIGIDDNFYFETHHSTLSRGDVLLLFSDGAYEVQNLGGKFFGLEGIREALHKHNKKDVHGILTHLKRELRLFSFLRGLNDDTTFVAVKKLKITR